MAAQEIWKWIEGYPEYAISNFGKVRRRAWLVKRFAKSFVRGGNDLNIVTTHQGYERVKLYIFDGKKTGNWFFVHRLVAMHFIDNPEKKPHVNHIDCIKNNNWVENLEWCTQKENQKHAIENDRYRPKRGTENRMAKLNDEKIREIKRLKIETGIFDSELGKMFNVSQSVITRVLGNKIWKHIQ